MKSELQTESVRIPTASGLLAGQLLRLQVQAYAPAVLLESPLAGSADALTQRMATALAMQGWVVLTFDHAGFGASGGTPGRLRWNEQVDHLRTVWWWLRKRTGIDGNRVGLWAHGLGAWRARMLLETETDVPAVVLHAPCWRQRAWFTRPATGLVLLQEAGYFDNTEPDPLLNPAWVLAWTELLRARLPSPKRLPDTPVLVWHRGGQTANDPVLRHMGAHARCEWMRLPDAGQSELVLTGKTAADSDPVLAETCAFFRQYI